MPPEAVLAPPPGIERPRTKASGSSSRHPQRSRGGGHAAGRSRHAASQAEDASNASSNGTGRRRRDGRDGRDGRDSASVAAPQPSPFANGTVSLMKREKPIEATEPQASSTRPTEEPIASTSTAAATNVPPTQPRATASSSSAAGGGLLQLPTEPRNHDPRPPRHHPKRSQDRGSRMSRGPSRNDPPERAPAGGGHPQLFDPKRHDALSFAKGLSSTSQSDARSSTAASTAPTSASAPSVASSEGRERGKRRPGSSRHGGSEQSGPSASGSKGSSTSRGANYLVNELKRIYRDISALETKLQEDHRKERAAAHAANGEQRATPQVDHAFWVNLVEQHKRLIDLHYAFLDSALQPGLPPSLRSLPADYEIPVRVWQTGCHLLIESMRQSLPYPCGASSEDHVSERDRQTQAALLDHLNDFIYSAYIFYTNLLESEHLTTFRKCWLESLGDLARYRMLMARLAVQGGGEDASGSIRNKASREARRNEAASPQSFARIDDDSDDAQDAAAAAARRARPVDEASIGSAALGDWDLEEKETWRTTAKGWYAQGLAEMPGTGRLHHHLAVLSRADELKALHHFCKSLTAAQPYSAARESLLPLFDATHQRRRVEPGAGFIDLFVHLHGMMITKVQLDDFDAVLERYEEQLLTKVEALGWEHGIGAPQLMMMASINIAALMQYGAEGAVLGGGGSSSGSDAKKSNGSTTTTAAASSKPTSPSPPQHNEGEELPIVLQCAIRLAFCTFAALLPNDDSDADHPPSIGAALNPYVTMLCTLLFRLSKVPLSHPPPTEQDPHPTEDASSRTLLDILTRSIPWQRLASLSPALASSTSSSIAATTGTSAKINSTAPLPEDWCLRGLAWTGRKIFEKDYWKPPATPPNPSAATNTTATALPTYESEVDVLDELAPDEPGQLVTPFGCESPSDVAMRQLRSHRIALALAALVDVVPGFEREEDGKSGAGRIVLRPPLTTKLEKWAREERERIEEEERLAKTTRALSQSALDDEGAEVKTSDEDDDENEEAEDDSDSLRALKAKRRQLRAMLREGEGPSPAQAAHKKASASPAAAAQQPLPGYTILVLDTNVFLTSPSPSSSDSSSIAHHLILSHHWTTIVPLAVLTELDGLSRNTTSSSNVAARAKEAVKFLEEGVRGATGGGGTGGGAGHGHGKWLKVQTSRGNYLSDLKLRSEDIDLHRTRKGQGKDTPSSSAAAGSGGNARTLDEVILSAFIWQLDHWVDRLPILCPSTTSSLPNSSSTTTATSSTPQAATLPDLLTQRAKITEGQTPKVVLVTLDRGLRLRARAALSGRASASTGVAGGEGKGCEGTVAGKDEIAKLLSLGDGGGGGGVGK